MILARGARAGESNRRGEEFREGGGHGEHVSTLCELGAHDACAYSARSVCAECAACVHYVKSVSAGRERGGEMSLSVCMWGGERDWTRVV